MTLARGSLLACLVSASLAAAACVPRGEPPAGRQMVADRTSQLVGIVRPRGDGVTRLLVTRTAEGSPDPFVLDLFVVSTDAAGTPPVERLLAAGVLGTLNSNCGQPECVDARGRIFVITGVRNDLGFPLLARIDPVTGDRLELGAAPYIILSPSGERLLVTDTPSGVTTLYEGDDRAIPLDGALNVGLLGEDLYYQTPQKDLMRIAPGGAPARLAGDVGSFIPQPLEGDQHPLLVLSRPTADPMVSTYAILDAATGEETPSPLGTTPIRVSPSGRWLIAVDYQTGRVTFVERATGSQEVSQFEAYTIRSYEWRPGHDELWFPGGDYQHPVMTIKQPGRPAMEVPGAELYAVFNERGFGSMFTGDGAHWFSSRGEVSYKPIIQVGAADDPTGPRFDIAPAGASIFQYWALADGRILVSSFANTLFRSDLYAVAPATGISTPLGEAGFVITVGQMRMVANLHVNDGRGDLTVVDLATAQATNLAPEFTLAAFVERRSADRAAPGAPIAFQFQARFASPYDGIWLATVP